MLPLLTIVTLDEGFATSAVAYIGELWTDFEPLILLIVGLPIAFWAIRKAMSLVRAR